MVSLFQFLHELTLKSRWIFSWTTMLCAICWIHLIQVIDISPSIVNIYPWGILFESTVIYSILFRSNNCYINFDMHIWKLLQKLFLHFSFKFCIAYVTLKKTGRTKYKLASEFCLKMMKLFQNFKSSRYFVQRINNCTKLDVVIGFPF